MALIHINNMLANGIPIPTLGFGVPTPAQVSITSRFTAQFTMARNDTVDFRVEVEPSSNSPNITIVLYRVNGTTASVLATRISRALDYRFSQDFVLGTYIIEISSQQAHSITVTASPRGFMPSDRINARAYSGEFMEAAMYVKKREQECSEDLAYELIEGELPPGLTLYPSGLIAGTVPELDCIPSTSADEEYSPSFGWYYTNHDGMNQSWARRWRFKVRVSIANQPDAQTEQWFCIRVFNNWSLDAASFVAATQETTVISEDTVTVTLPTIPKPQPQEALPFIPWGLRDVETRYKPVTYCIPCDDPTTPHITERYTIPKELVVRTPDELLNYYIEHQQNFEPLIMQLHNSKILHEYLAYVGREARNERVAYEILIKGRELTLTKYAVDGRSLGDIDQQILSTRNIVNQVVPNDAVMYCGESMKGVLTW